MSQNAVTDSHGDGQHDGREDHEAPICESVLLTGWPELTTRRMCARILDRDQDAGVHLLMAAAFEDEGRAFLARLPAEQRARAQIVVGDVAGMDLGLSGREYQALAGEITTIHHMVSTRATSMDRELLRRVNVEGTRGIVELASEARQLRRLCHWSSILVSGRRKGIVLEDELEEGQSFHDAYGEAKFQAEVLARRAQRRLPVTIFRPGLIVGDSQSGEIDSFEGPGSLMVLIATNATPLGLPLAGRGTAPLNVVPIDYVIDAAYALSMDERAAGKTFHLTDPNPLSARRMYEIVAERSHTTPPRGFIPGGLARFVMRAPGLGRLARGPLSFLGVADHQVFYNCRNTQELLADTEIRCPPFDAYVDSLIRYMKDAHAARTQRRADDDADPLD